MVQLGRRTHMPMSGRSEHTVNVLDVDVPTARFVREHHKTTGVDLPLKRGPDGEVLPQERQLMCQ
jgi:hypothetical protein